jgi:hypothetical protein
MASPQSYGANAAGYSSHDAVSAVEMGAIPEKVACATTPAGTAHCTFGRQELQDLLRESGYGAQPGPYNAYFRPDPADPGGNVCRSCGMPIGMHASTTIAAAVVDAGAALPDATAGMARPLVRLGEVFSAGIVNDTSGGSIERPLHWRGGAWYARFLEFDGYGAVTSEIVGSGKHRRVVTRVSARWRCVAPHADPGARGSECGALFHTKGFLLDSAQRPRHGACADFSVIRDAADAMEKHFREVHQLEHVAPQGWTASLFGCCQDPTSVVGCLCCYVLPPPMCCHNGYGKAFCCALEASAPKDIDDHGLQALTSATAHHECQCSLAFASTLHFVVLVGHGAMFLGLTIAASIITMCGFPCNSDKFPPLLCWFCHKRRRRIVHAVGSDESSCETRCITLFCFPCSELQQWNEVVNSGVWPGLLCCGASATARSRMEPSAVRARYSVGGEYGVRAQIGAGAEARRLAATVAETRGPAVMMVMT